MAYKPMDYKAVIEDFNNGTLDPKKVTLIMDNDGGYWSVNLDEPDGDASDEEWYRWETTKEKEQNRLEEKYGSPDGYRDIVNVLVAAGVKCDWC